MAEPASAQDAPVLAAEPPKDDVGISEPVEPVISAPVDTDGVSAKPIEPSANDRVDGAKQPAGLLARIMSGAKAIPGNVYINATAEGYLRLRSYDKSRKKWTFIDYLGAIRPKRAGAKRVSAKHMEQYEQRKKRRSKKAIG